MVKENGWVRAIFVSTHALFEWEEHATRLVSVVSHF